MGRVLKRVPLDFDWPIKRQWPGYLVNFCGIFEGYDDPCHYCHKFARLMGYTVPEGKYICPDFPLDPPKGEGYQLWETTTEGSPTSPVFETLDELCEWAEYNATVFGSAKTTKENWKEMLEEDFVHLKKGNITFI